MLRCFIFFGESIIFCLFSSKRISAKDDNGQQRRFRPLLPFFHFPRRKFLIFDIFLTLFFYFNIKILRILQIKVSTYYSIISQEENSEFTLLTSRGNQ